MSRRCLAESQDDFKRVEVLAAATEILLAAGEDERAGEAADELAAVSARRRSPVVEAAEAQARAAVDLAAGRPGEVTLLPEQGIGAGPCGDTGHRIVKPPQ